MRIAISKIECHYSERAQRVKNLDCNHEGLIRGNEGMGWTSEVFENPNWSLIESSLEPLRSECGQVVLSFGRDNFNHIQIDSAGQYLMCILNIDYPMQNDSSKEVGVYALIDKTVPVVENLEELAEEGIRDHIVEIGAGECPQHNTIADFDAVVSSIKSYLELDENSNSDRYVWLDINENDERF